MSVRRNEIELPSPYVLNQRAALYSGLLSPDDFAHLIGWKPDPWQRSILWSRRNMLLCCGRQGGKSTGISPKPVYMAFSRPESTCLIIARSERQSKEMLRKVRRVFQRLPWKERFVQDNATEIELCNGSRIISVPSILDTVVCFSVDLLIEDEAARVTDDIFLGTRPMLAVTKGQHILASTPLGKRGHFYQQWEGRGNWQRLLVPSTQNPRIEPSYLEEEMETLGPYWFEQEYLCKFQDAVGGVFTSPFMDEDELPWAA